jgi:hypothetical protein
LFLASVLAGYSRSKAFCLPCSRSEVVPQSLRTRLTDMELRADCANRRHATRCQLTGEYPGRSLLKRIPGFRLAEHAVRHHLSTADNHREQLVRPDQRDRRPRSHSRPNAPRPAVASGIIHNRPRDWDTGNHPGYSLGTWLRDYKEQVFLFTREFAVSWTNNVSERGAKAAKRHQAVSGYHHSPPSADANSRPP